MNLKINIQSKQVAATNASSKKYATAEVVIAEMLRKFKK